MSSFLLFQQCPACLVRLIWMVFEMGGIYIYIKKEVYGVNSSLGELMEDQISQYC